MEITRTHSSIEHIDLDQVARSPLQLAPIAVPRVWGGDRLRRELHADLETPDASTPIGETWEVSDVGEGGEYHSVVRSGPAQGWSLRDLIRVAPEGFLGSDWREHVDDPEQGPTLPLLYKFIDARQNLSVQVHPSDELLQELGTPGRGKTEAWVIIDAAEGAEIIYGLDPEMTQEEFLERASTRHGVEGLRHVPVSRGDVIYLPAGTIHAIGAGILLAEIQQSSDITYRIYDWGRVGLDGQPRQLHLKEASRVAPPAFLPPCPVPAPEGAQAGLRRRIDGHHFILDELHLEAGTAVELPSEASTPRFGILSVLAGSLDWSLEEAPDLSLEKGDTVFVPAECPRPTLSSRDGAWALWMCPAEPGSSA